MQYQFSSRVAAIATRLLWCADSWRGVQCRCVLAKTMGMAVVAEGMERVEPANFLLARGCRLMQGFLFARPVPAGAFAALLRDGLVMPSGLCVNAEVSAAAMQSFRGLLTASVISHAHLALSAQQPA